LSFIKDAVNFLARYNLMSKFDVNLLIRSVVNMKKSFLEKQSDVIDIVSHLVPHLPKNNDLKNLLKEVESTFETRVDKLNDRNLVNFYYYYFMYDHAKNERFLRSLESEIVLRVDNFSANQMEESLKLFTLKDLNKGFHTKLYSVLEANLISHLNQIDEIGIIRVVNSLSHTQELSKAFCIEFEKVVSAKCPVLSNPTLLAVLNFVTLEQFKLSSDIIYEIEIEIISRRFANVNKHLIKDMTASKHYHSKNSLINNIFKYSLSSLEESKAENLLEAKSKQTGEPSKEEVLSILEEKKASLHEEILKEIEHIRNPFDLKLVLNISMILKIDNPKIIKAFFKKLEALSYSNELSLTYLTNIIENLQELQFFIYLDEHKHLFNLFTDNIRLRIHEANPATCADLVRILSRLILYGQHKETLTELLSIVANKIITEKYFYVIQERIDLLYYLSMSQQSCNRALVEFLLSFFDPETNKFYEKEIYYLHVRRFYVLWSHIKHYIPDIQVKNPKLQEIFEKGKENMQEHKEWLDDKRAESVLLKEARNILEKAAKQAKNVTINESPSVSCYTTDFELISNEGSVYLDILSSRNFHINNPNLLNAEKLSKSQFLKENGKNYQIIKYKPGSTYEERLDEMHTNFKSWLSKKESSQ